MQFLRDKYILMGGMKYLKSDATLFMKLNIMGYFSELSNCTLVTQGAANMP